MIVVREFEFYASDGYIIASPCDMDGGTFGDDLDDAIESAADWLFETATCDMAAGRDTQGGTFGHEPQNGGKIIALAVSADLREVEAVTAADAARMLDISTARVSQMCADGVLPSWIQGTHRMIRLDSVKSRMDKHPRAGRPKSLTTA